MDLLALLIASFSLPAVVGAVLAGALLFLSWGWGGAVLGAIAGYLGGVWYAQRVANESVSPYAKGWMSLVLFIGGLLLLAIATR
ncbi:hypothetical protein [Hyphomicrobium sulfonivorans]|uniref:Uncharacterized protein n=1 Tax=Hyphomicrobium sulfonivorans TaxID=121290 RepID=A0A109BJV9_HYPSL|nr:hypothetical protein [Hyphomicrobium sulfonivorans]KWT70166.1 hypothetical protein APY04_1094 [Hyphomicrobium sulfonivorans]MBI1650763.1 hypothetical protein [Hyphomicrobium sulfonivorans]NSL71879.1 hypothetical protein [Hyphomicrobium sulfonivorans]